MKVKVLAFGIAKDIFGSDSITLELKDTNDTEHLRTLLEVKYPELKKLASYMIAVNEEYAQGSSIINDGDEIAIIPPVSGG
ncbi:MAG: molybdopterin converting factor subunit 1 [Chitinophagaceae bacterium]|nr:molybdopterin converting factor subunit 1 [Chitinophagaceae bacterium]